MDRTGIDEEKAFSTVTENISQLAKKHSDARLIAWMIVNTLATIGIVFTNKQLFLADAFKHEQLTFTAFHFTVTGLTMYMLSMPQLAFFERKRARLVDIAPLAMIMCFNVVLPNLSLVYSSIAFYQAVRILLTPVVAILNYTISRATIPRLAVLSLVPTCLGVGIISHYETLPSADGSTEATSPLGVFYSLAGVLMSSLYTVWIAAYHKKLGMNSMQLLFNQAPLGAAMLTCVIPFFEDTTVWGFTTLPTWCLICLSGCLAVLINLSQFFIINEAGPVSSTVVGHLKTCCIVTLGWATSNRKIADGSMLGLLAAFGGMIWYSVIMQRER